MGGIEPFAERRVQQSVTLALVAQWAHGRSVSRSLPLPTVDGTMICVETNQPDEERRFIFAAPTPAIAALAATIVRPRNLVKLCAPVADLMAWLPATWRDHPQSYFMICDGPMRPSRPLPSGYVLGIRSEGAVAVAEVRFEGNIVARGRAVNSGDLLVFDQIMTDSNHGRRGLASGIMHGLELAGGGAKTRSAGQRCRFIRRPNMVTTVRPTNNRHKVRRFPAASRWALPRPPAKVGPRSEDRAIAAMQMGEESPGSTERGAG
jgi:hypothetical protein